MRTWGWPFLISMPFRKTLNRFQQPVMINLLLSRDKVSHTKDVLWIARHDGRRGAGVLSLPGLWRSFPADHGPNSGCLDPGKYPQGTLPGSASLETIPVLS